MKGQVLITRLLIKDLLSFGRSGIDVKLGPLNVLVGPNGSGKSNFIEVIHFLHYLPTNVNQIFYGSNATDWIWKGLDKARSHKAVIQVDLLDDFQDPFRTDDDEFLDPFSDEDALFITRHTIDFSISNGIKFHTEQIQSRYNNKSRDTYKYHLGVASIERTTFSDELKEERKDVVLNGINSLQSILHQRRDPDAYPTISEISDKYEGMRFYTEPSFGRFTLARRPQDITISQDFLAADASNLAMVLNDLDSHRDVMASIIEKLKVFYARAEKIITRVNDGTIQVFIQEEGLQTTVPATRLSDGTLRYLSLLVILLHPTPPHLICIEEPELGMHPDIIPTIAELLIEASKRTQLIVTTHSDLLISKLRDIPESILVCDHTDDGTTIKHLDQDDLDSWLQDYSLGEIWLKGVIGGTRW